MRILGWIIRIVVFLGFLLFAMSNTEVVALRLWGANLAWSAPLVLFLLAFFAAGASLGLLALVPTLVRQRREINRLRRLEQAAQSAQTVAVATERGPIVDMPPPLL
jgi:uncharacterized integral membrane protein